MLESSQYLNEFTNQFYKSIHNELFDNILPYWEKHSRDTRPGFEGFFGQIDNDNTCHPECERSIVMTSRFLWTYSNVARMTKDDRYLKMADFAYDVITKKYWDKKNGGVYWSVMADGSPKISKKQIYGEAFCIYGLSEYAAATHSENAMNLALVLFNLLEKYARDTVRDSFNESAADGYIEACAQDWSPTTDMILSPKDMNCPKSMNTNLHVMEAYTNLYRTLPLVFPDAKEIRAQVGTALSDLVQITVNKILQPNAHLGMFFDMDWKPLSGEISYGHDIEASWLLWEAVCELEASGSETTFSATKDSIRDTVIRIADVALKEGFDHQNGCMEDSLRSDGKGNKIRNRNRVWWVQAEAMNGFYNAWEMTGDEKYSEAFHAQWDWIQNYQVDRQGGDWWNELNAEGKPILTEDKGGNWKTSYHNGRTCLELLRRSGNL